MVGLSSQVLTGIFPQVVLYTLYSHFLTCFQQLLLLGLVGKSKTCPPIPGLRRGTPEGSAGKGASSIVLVLDRSSQYGGARGLRFLRPVRFPLHWFCQTSLHSWRLYLVHLYWYLVRHWILFSHLFSHSYLTVQPLRRNRTAGQAALPEMSLERGAVLLLPRALPRGSTRDACTNTRHAHST